MGVTAAVAAVVGTGYTVYNGERAAEAQQKALVEQKKSQDEARGAAQREAQRQEQQMNAANAKAPDASNVLAKAQQDAKGGQSGTMLTGPQGIDPSMLALGKNTLLGG